MSTERCVRAAPARSAVGVVPPEAFLARARLWRALEQAFPVSFQPREQGQLDGLDAAIFHAVQPPPALGLPALHAYGSETDGTRARVRLSSSGALPACLR